ncbi:hypothetical protein Salat_1481400 [Sesamum alatum]|uniref:Myb/SANT-like domain-containing protein n=1 Tax=Sesamum alatum TaxID=300844 RepID=A0AAE1YBM0_9LAMI|nr:hypothetical protein Salat_1481400 [Sesamum alatum]
MWPDGYYFQRQFFCNTRWTKQMEKTFIDSLLEHARTGQFRVGRENHQAIQSALRDVNKAHDANVTYPWAVTRVQKLHQRLQCFLWVVNMADVVWNRNLRFVTAVDSVWREICRENKLTRCYVNAYEELLEELCMLFGQPVEDEDAPAADAPPEGPPPVALGAAPQPVAIGAAPQLVEGFVDPALIQNDDELVILPVVHVISDTSDSSSFIWRFIDEYYGSESDADYVLPPPGVPGSIAKKKPHAAEKSPGGHSQGQASSSASNTTPVKKEV